MEQKVRLVVTAEGHGDPEQLFHLELVPVLQTRQENSAVVNVS